MHGLIRAVALLVVFAGVALIALGISLAALNPEGGASSGAACVVIFFIPLCFSWGSNAAALGAAAAAISLAILVIAVLVLRKFLEGLAPSE